MTDPTPAHDPAHLGCEEFEEASRLSRRSVLKGLAAGTGAVVASQLVGEAMMEASFAATGGNVLVVVSFRGGIDGLGMVVPHGDTAYARARPSINVPASTLLAKDALFGLHPEMRPLLPLWQQRRMAAVHAVGMKVPNRSHFQAIEIVEDSDPGSRARTGWLNRMIGLGGIVGPVEAVHLSSPPLSPTSFAGPAPTLATDRFDNLRLEGVTGSRFRPRYDSMSSTWAGVGGPLGQGARSAIAISKGLATTMATPVAPANGAAYPASGVAKDLARALKDTAKLIRLNLGTSVVSIDYGSWDMHADYGTQEGGQMKSMVAGFAASVAAFFADLGTLGSRVTLVTVSEFGRRVQENGNRGLDHGWGNMMLVMGGGVRGGQYYGQWPGLAAGSLVAGDLQVTTDYRNVLGEVVARRFPDRSLAGVFPGLTYEPVGLML